METQTYEPATIGDIEPRIPEKYITANKLLEMTTAHTCGMILWKADRNGIDVFSTENFGTFGHLEIASALRVFGYNTYCDTYKDKDTGGVKVRLRIY